MLKGVRQYTKTPLKNHLKNPPKTPLKTPPGPDNIKKPGGFYPPPLAPPPAGGERENTDFDLRFDKFEPNSRFILAQNCTNYM